MSQQAQAQLETARTQAEDTRLRRAQTEHAIAVLVGQEASGFTISARAEEAPAQMPQVEVGVPSHLLERRPDVAAAERRVAAANAAIGVARAAYFPTLTLDGSAGCAEPDDRDPGSPRRRNSGRSDPRLCSPCSMPARTLRNQRRRTPLTTSRSPTTATRCSPLIQDVEDNLVALRQLQRESVSEAAAVNATQGALEQANLRYKGGLVTYLEVVSTENAALAARLAAADIEIRRANATVLLVRALGGDWNLPPPP